MSRKSGDALTLVQRSFNYASDDLGRRVVRGASFTFMGIFFRTLITVGSMSILARLLTPADFGRIAMATVVTELAALFANFGFGSILIQRERITRIQLDTVCWAAMALGFLLSVAVFGFSFFAGMLFADPVAAQLLRVLCITFILDELTVVPSCLLSRLMMFRQIFLIQVAMLLARAGAAILLAWYGFGVWSLVLGSLVGNFMQCAAYSYIVGYWPRWKFCQSFLFSTWRTNGSYFGGGFLFYLNSNIDLLIVGRVFGAVSLGYYQNARSLTDEIRARIAMPLQRVLFPVFSAIQSDQVRFREGVKRSGRLLSLLVIPLGFGGAALSEELVAVLYGDQWLAMIPILQIISAGAGVRAAATVSGPVFNATNRVGLSLRLNIVSSALVVASILIGSHWGLFGIAMAQLFGAVLSIVMLRIALGLIGLGCSDLWGILGAPLLASTVMLAMIALARSQTAGIFSDVFVRLALFVVFGAGVYMLTIVLLGRRHVADIVDLRSRFMAR